MMFGKADDPWIPTLLDIERLKAEDTEGPVVDWKKFGWDALEVPASAPQVASRMDVLNGRFIANYGWRMLGYETMEQWQTKLQERFDSVVDKYERAYSLYEENKDAMMKDVLPGRKVSSTGATVDTEKETNKAGGDDKDSYKSKYSDTPDSAINDSDNYAGSITKDDRTTTYGRTDDKDRSRTSKIDGTVNEVYTGAQIMTAVNDSIDGWRDIDTSFIMEFQNLFSNVFWY